MYVMPKAKQVKRFYKYEDTDSDTTDSGEPVEKKEKKGKVCVGKCFKRNIIKPCSDDVQKKARSKSAQKVRYNLPQTISNYDESSEDCLKRHENSAVSKYRVGLAPRPPGKPGLGGGVAIYILKDEDCLPSNVSCASNSKKATKSTFKLKRKRSY